MARVLILESFDDPRSADVRFVQEAARLGSVEVLFPSDAVVESLTGHPTRFPQEERLYFVDALRFVSRVIPFDEQVKPDTLPAGRAAETTVWAVREADDTPAKRAFCDAAGLEYVVIRDSELQGWQEPVAGGEALDAAGRRKVVVTGCYDWLHSGHVRFFEEVAELGDLYVVVGNDRSVELLKGPGHPLHRVEERRYMAGSIRHVKQTLITSGLGWLDATPEIERIQPDVWAVNEDGDRPEKREFCAVHEIEYRVFERRPRAGLPIRRSVDLRGF